SMAPAALIAATRAEVSVWGGILIGARMCQGSRLELTWVNMMVPICSEPDINLAKTIGFRYIYYGAGSILSALAQAKSRYPKLTPVNHAAGCENSRLPQFKSL